VSVDATDHGICGIHPPKSDKREEKGDFSDGKS
jgi:hypothetical protein